MIIATIRLCCARYHATPASHQVMSDIEKCPVTSAKLARGQPAFRTPPNRVSHLTDVSKVTDECASRTP